LRKIACVLLIQVFLILLPSCSMAVKAPAISEPTLAKIVDKNTSKPIQSSKKFNQSDLAIYFSIKITDFPDNTKLKAIWKRLSDGRQISSEITTKGTGYEVFTLKRGDSLFPPGQYEVAVTALVDTQNLVAKGAFEISADDKLTHLLNPVTSKSVDNQEKLNPVNVTSEFAQNDPVIYFVVQTKDIPKDTSVSCLWVHTESGESLSHELLAEGSRSIAFSLKPDNGQKLPPGKYIVTATAVVNNESESVYSEFEIK